MMDELRIQRLWDLVNGAGDVREVDADEVEVRDPDDPAIRYRVEPDYASMIPADAEEPAHLVVGLTRGPELWQAVQRRLGRGPEAAATGAIEVLQRALDTLDSGGSSTGWAAGQIRLALDMLRGEADTPIAHYERGNHDDQVHAPGTHQFLGHPRRIWSPH